VRFSTARSAYLLDAVDEATDGGGMIATKRGRRRWIRLVIVIFQTVNRIWEAYPGPSDAVSAPRPVLAAAEARASRSDKGVPCPSSSP